MARNASARLKVMALTSLAAGTAAVGFPAASSAATRIIVRPGQSIQAAVDSASPGDTILVKPGTYSEPGVGCPANPAQTCAVAITKDNIRLIGLTQGARQVSVVNPGGQDVGIEVARTGDPACLSDPAETVHGSVVRGLTVSGFGSDGLDVVCAGTWRVTQVRAVGNEEYGIFPSLAGPGRVDHSFASGANDTGIYVGQSHDVRVDHNIAAGNVSGFEIENSSAVRLDHNKATGNTAGILSFTLPFLAVTSNSGNRIDHNLVRDNNKPNTCTPGGDVCAVPAGSGIALVAADTNQVDHNRVHGNKSFGIIAANVCNAFHLSPAQCAALGIDPNPDQNHIGFNKATGNGKSPDPGIAPLPGADLLWDGTGSGNCWAHNAAGSTFPAKLPGCG
jgi:parallel beta-helix repeat protein